MLRSRTADYAEKPKKNRANFECSIIIYFFSFLFPSTLQFFNYFHNLSGVIHHNNRQQQHQQQVQVQKATALAMNKQKQEKIKKAVADKLKSKFTFTGQVTTPHPLHFSLTRGR